MYSCLKNRERLCLDFPECSMGCTAANQPWQGVCPVLAYSGLALLLFANEENASFGSRGCL